MGKGRPKGYSPYTDISYEELGDWVGRKTMVKVSRAWLDDLRGSPDPSKAITTEEHRSINDILRGNPEAIPCPSTEPQEIQPKIEFNLTTFDNE